VPCSSVVAPVPRLNAIRICLQHAEVLKSPIYITPSRASKSAISAVEKAGGSVVCRYYNDLALQDCVRGRTDRIAAAPTAKKDIGEKPLLTLSLIPFLHSPLVPLLCSIMDQYAD
jgi:hypothetical protein